ncbi:DUF3052 domain-containing protein [Angustibacter aerolatus]
MSATADPAAEKKLPDRLGLRAGQVVQELGWDDDVDDDLRVGFEDAVDGELLDEDGQEVADVVLLWWRDDDGDLVDALVDALTNLGERGTVVLLTPKAGRDGHTEPSEIAEAAPAAGLHVTSSVSASKDWGATILVAPRGGRK